MYMLTQVLKTKKPDLSIELYPRDLADPALLPGQEAFHSCGRSIKSGAHNSGAHHLLGVQPRRVCVFRVDISGDAQAPQEARLALPLQQGTIQ